MAKNGMVLKNRNDEDIQALEVCFCSSQWLMSHHQLTFDFWFMIRKSFSIDLRSLSVSVSEWAKD